MSTNSIVFTLFSLFYLIATPTLLVQSYNTSFHVGLFEHQIDNDAAFVDSHDDRIRYLLFAPRQIRPDTILRVFFHLLRSTHPVRVQASLRTVNSAAGTFSVDPLQESDAGMLFDRSVTLLEWPRVGSLLIPLPVHLPPARYSLLLLGDPPDRNGGSLFRHVVPLDYSERFLTILIQTNQLVYNVRQTIRARIVLLDLRQQPWDQPIDVWLIDSREIIMKRWVSVYPFQGMISVQFQLPSDYSKGWWKIKVQAGFQIEERSLLVERWFTSRFDVEISSPPFIEVEEQVLPVQIAANYTNYLPVHANASLRVQIKPQVGSQFQEWGDAIFVYEHFEPEFRGQMHLQLPLAPMIAKLFPAPSAGALINIEVMVTELYQATSVAAFSNTLLRNQTVSLRFMDRSPVLFKPGFPFTTELLATRSDSRPLTPEQLLSAQVELRTSFFVTGPEKVHSLQNTIPLQLNSDGLAVVRFHVPRNLSNFELVARYFDGLVERSASLKALAFQSPSGRMLQVESSTERAMVAEYAILHVRANFRLDHLHYIVTSKGVQLLHNRVEASKSRESISTFEITMSAEMVPACRVLVYTVTADGELIADSFLLPVHFHNSANSRPFTLKVNLQQDKLGEKPQLIPNAGPSSLVAFWALDRRPESQLHAFAGINAAHVQLQMDRLESVATRKRLLLRNEFGLPIRSQRLSITQSNLDTGQAVQLADIRPMGNIEFHVSPLCGLDPYTEIRRQTEYNKGRQIPTADSVEPLKWPASRQSEMFAPVGGLYSGYSIADNFRSEWFSPNRYDSLQSWSMPTYDGDTSTPWSHFWPLGLYTQSKSELAEMQAKDKVLNEALGERKWRCVNSEMCIPERLWCDGKPDCSDGSDELDCDLASDWQTEQLLTFLVRRTSRSHAFFDSTGQDFAWQHTFTGYTDDNYVLVPLPTRPTQFDVFAYALHAEHGFRLLNEHPTVDSERPFDMTLEAPTRIVQGEQLGLQVALFNNRPIQLIVEVLLHSSPDYRFVQVEAGGYVSAYKARTRSGTQQHILLIREYERRLVPIPVVATTAGVIQIHVSARCWLKDVHRRLTVQVLPEGVPVQLHTSLLLDLRAQGQMLKFLDINVTEEAEIPYQVERRFLYGSPAAYVYAIGDVVGAPVLVADQSNLVDFADLDISRSADCGQLYSFNFAYHVHSAHYLRLTGQLDSEQLKRWLRVLNQDYVHVSSFFDRNCCFAQFGPHSGSVWLNAHLVATMAAASYSEWDTYLHIDPKLIQAAVEFILKHQTKDGYFLEPTFNPLLYQTRRWQPVRVPSFNQTPRPGLNSNGTKLTGESGSDAIFRYFNQPTLGSIAGLKSYAESNFFYQNHTWRVPTEEERLRLQLMPLPEYMWPEHLQGSVSSSPDQSHLQYDFKLLLNPNQMRSSSGNTTSPTPSNGASGITLEPAFAEPTPEVTPGPPEPPGQAYAGLPLDAYPDLDHRTKKPDLYESLRWSIKNPGQHFDPKVWANHLGQSTGSPAQHNDFAYRLTPVALTAHVLLSLSQVPGLQGENAARLEQAKQIAVQYLESRLALLTSPFELAISTHALLAAGKAAEAQAGFDRLHQTHQHTDGMMYWSRSRLAAPSIRHETQRTYTQFRAPDRFDAETVEATSHALQVYTRLNGLQQEQIVRFLNHMRLHAHGFVGPFDTIVAMQALTEFTFRQHVRSVTRLHVQLEPSSEPYQRFYWTLGECDLQMNSDQSDRPAPSLWPAMVREDNHPKPSETADAAALAGPSVHARSVNHLTRSKAIEEQLSAREPLATEKVARVFPHVWGHVTALIEGSGYGVLQLRTTYNVDREHLLLQPPVKAFDLNVRYLYSGRNQSSLDVEACARWLLTNESLFSDLAVLEIDLPTGYLQVRQAVDDYVDAGIIPNLKRARISPRIAVFMFDHIYPNGTCVRFNVERWFPVANSTKWLQAKIYELNRPELFTTRIIENYVLYVMDICRVCGSYQCPYCPYYSAGPSPSSPGIVLMVSLVIGMFVQRWIRSAWSISRCAAIGLG